MRLPVLPVVIATWLGSVAMVAEPAAWASPAKRRADRRANKRVPSSQTETPWSVGVPEEAQKRALKLFREGNASFEEAKYTEAVAKYERALAAWDHPNIRFNMAMCLINMRQPLAAWSHLERALAFGEAPLGQRLHTEALRAVAILDSSLAELTVKSSQPGIRVMVDGGQVLDGPGEHSMRLLPGKHQLVASRSGYVTDSRALNLVAGEPVVEQISLAREQVRVLREGYERRWSWWVPWSVAGSSVVLGLTGGAFYLSARSDIREYDDALADMCPTGCSDDQIPEPLKQKERAASRKSGVAIGLWATGGAMLVAGGVMAILNRPRKREVRRVEPLITVSRDYVGVGLSLDLE